MKIAFDCRYVRIDNHDGISRFSAELVAALAALHPVTMLIHDERQLARLPDLPWFKITAPTSPREPLIAAQVNRLRPDVVFTPMQTMGSWRRQYRLVLTVHDLIYYTHPTPPRDLPAPVRLLWRLYHLSWWPQRALLNRADAIVAVSNTTRQLIAQHRLTRQKVTVVRNATGGPLSDPPPQQARERLLVYMGSFMPYKNVETLVRAMRLLPGWSLHLLSRISEGDRKRLSNLAPEADLIFHDGVSDEVYRHLLGRATALVSASQEEGFGIPIIESMAQGTPVVVSDIPIFREIAGPAGRFAPADSPAAFAAEIAQLDDFAIWQGISEECRGHAATFSWESSAEILLQLLTDIVHAKT